MSAEEEKISAWRGHEDNGGEGQLGREPGYSGGGQFFPKENLCKLLFVRILLSLSQVQGCISCGILLSGTGARGVSSEHMENMEMFSCSPT